MVISVEHIKHLLKYHFYLPDCKQCLELYGGWIKPKCQSCEEYDHHAPNATFYASESCVHGRAELLFARSFWGYRIDQDKHETNLMNRIIRYLESHNDTTAKPSTAHPRV